ncbi:hypothetical protein [Pyxidicoccus xibeiensis]|uniref:hypothetical protein n=1 Tax=Pyxidicoccus xibeiensis TaxID=2906759 RepID=UPI0020A6EBB5|nr:hypothetical protein [Pyxidicoccus xibeiensis]MCP3140141.1 hypothetical protein [Pyxidicoccus xibeiensis]
MTSTRELAPRSAYLLDGEARSAWQHTLSPVEALRYSLRFRTVLASKARSAARQPGCPTSGTAGRGSPGSLREQEPTGE